jgi:hypothetical protein
MLFICRCFAPLVLCCAALSYADQPPVAAKKAEAKRSDPRPAAVPEVLKQYNYAEQVTALTDPANLVPVPGSALVEPQYAVNGSKPGVSSESKTILTKTDVPLTGMALEAVRVSDKWRTEKHAASGRTGRPRSVQLRRGPPDCRMRTTSCVHHRTAGRREDRRRAADRRLCPVEHLPCPVRRR